MASDVYKSSLAVFQNEDLRQRGFGDRHKVFGMKYRCEEFGCPLWLPPLDEFSRECLSIDVGRKLDSEDVMDRLARLFAGGRIPQYIRSDNGSEFTSKRVRGWLECMQVKTLFITPGSPWENGYIESFNGKLRDELLNLEIFDTRIEADVLIQRWQKHYNEVRPHSSLGYRSPAPEAISPSCLSTFATLKPPNSLKEELKTIS